MLPRLHFHRLSSGAGSLAGRGPAALGGTAGAAGVRRRWRAGL